MDTITAIATEHGLGVLKSTLKSQANRYQLVGASTHNASSTSVFHESQIDNSYYDTSGVLTFIVNLPSDEDFQMYLYEVRIVDASGSTIVSAKTPKIALSTGIGGMLTIKAAVSGEPGEIVFKATDYITGSELTDLWMNPVYANATATIQNATRQIQLHNRILTTEGKAL
ncbi:hypothetical protein [Marinomonas mediterranea]|jgi:hypothetical protein|uniref:Uncharacterized protein n=1 Tax=Marinomonas mediterranea (strain ATCC 700492 / JCM 21426 / NBRC 103028 / MMB-1) TaxID=717774 RepID=F2K1R3_MARM1|nr:hypothetical protein [Marinomonas mediterranea]ADZ93397.1 hypothetical protein Marme_4198 [Marinomonas mediterranea MMB-1]WCN11285.1 hypothetical protein GV055_21295 [Marinomonas mediterranea]WCN15350.1 hypothetical protein GV054_21225 [Marinomonas mediterranea]WCN19391.1 hypothetical protein GV053_21255 [Marinomonas mediterranea MMB-1]